MEQAINSNWWTRNWKWFVPAGCLSLLLLLGGFIALVASFAFGLMKSSEPYKLALDRAKANPAVIEALGKPVEAGFFTSGSVNVNGGSGTAELSIPIAGPQGKGTIYVESSKSAGEWSFTKLTVAVETTKQRIDLLAPR